VTALLLLAVLAPLAASAAPLEPVPATCTAKLIDAVSADMKAREARVSALARRVRSEKVLLVDVAHATMSLRLEAPGINGRDPFSYAVRLEAQRPFLSEKEWEKGVGLWADWLEKTELAWERADAADYCGLQAEGRSFAQDGYLMFLPFIVAAKGDDSMAPYIPAAAAAGALSLGLDVVAFVPNVALAAGRKLAKDSHVRRAAKAFRRFADYVESLEQKPPAKP
jgi:hypothetical protein